MSKKILIGIIALVLILVIILVIVVINANKKDDNYEMNVKLNMYEEEQYKKALNSMRWYNEKLLNEQAVEVEANEILSGYNEI